VVGNELPEEVPTFPPSTVSDLQKPETESLLASCPVHPYKGQERNRAGNQDVEGH